MKKRFLIVWHQFLVQFHWNNICNALERSGLTHQSLSSTDEGYREACRLHRASVRFLIAQEAYIPARPRVWNGN